MKLEELLNNLIKKGWKPRGEKVELHGTSKNTFGEKIVIFNGNAGGFKRWGCTYRELVSKESNLRQFVCENNLIKTKGQRIKINTEDFDGHHSFFIIYGYEYWIVISALYNEDELEKFLLENIKI